MNEQDDIARRNQWSADKDAAYEFVGKNWQHYKEWLDEYIGHSGDPDLDTDETRIEYYLENKDTWHENPAHFKRIQKKCWYQFKHRFNRSNDPSVDSF